MSACTSLRSGAADCFADMADSSTFAQTRRSISCVEQRWKRGRWPLVSGSLLPAIRSPLLLARAGSGRLQHWQIRRLFAFENATGVDAGIAVTFYDVRAIADQPATDGIFAKLINRGHFEKTLIDVFCGASQVFELLHCRRESRSGGYDYASIPL